MFSLLNSKIGNTLLTLQAENHLQIIRNTACDSKNNLYWYTYKRYKRLVNSKIYPKFYPAIFKG